MISETYEKRSINFHTPHELCTVQYNDIDSAVNLSLEMIQRIRETQGTGGMILKTSV